MTTSNTTNTGTTSLNDIRPQGDYVRRDAIEEGDYPILELLGVEDSESEEFGKYTHFHVKVLASVGDEAAPVGSERKISIRRDATGNLGVAKAISMVSLLTQLNDGKDSTDREAFLGSIKEGSANGKRFGARLEVEGRAKKYTFRPAQQA